MSGRAQPPRPTVLVIEDDEETRRAVVRELHLRGYETAEAADASSALRRWEQRRPDLVLLDLGLPDMDGKEVLTEARKFYGSPILVLSARDREAEKIAALDLGADDYVEKPFAIGEFLARLRTALRHSGAGEAQATPIEVGPLTLDVARHLVTVGGRTVELTPREFELLRVLLTNQGRIVTKGRLLRAVWGEAYQGEDSYVYVHVSQLRRKLAAADRDGALRDLIVTEPGVGYRVREAAR